MTQARRQAIVEKDKRYVWHPYTQMQKYIESGQPLVIERAQGSRLVDMDGRRIIDGNASWWTSLLGHNHPRLVRALSAQAEKLCHTSLAGVTHPPAVDFAEALVARAPQGLDHVFFSDNGSTAVESAMKMALQFFRQNGQEEKTEFLALEHAFHGETMGVTGISGVEAFRRPFAGLTLPAHHLPTPADHLESAVAKLAQVLAEGEKTIAGFVVEPLIQGAGGMRIYEPEYLRVARELTEKHGVLLIVDEVFTGYGRTGPFWACEHAAVKPDILCAAKGLSGGVLPFAATLCTDAIFEGFFGDASRAFYYGHTYCGNPLGAAVAQEVLRIYDEEGVVERAQPKARRIAETFSALGELPGVARSRSLGMCGALELGTRGGYLERSGWRVYEEALRRGAYVRPLGNVVYLTPALNIPDEDLDELLAIVTESVTLECRARRDA